MPDLRSGASTATLSEDAADPPRPRPVHATPPSEDDPVARTDDEAEPQDAGTPRARRPAAPRRPNPPDLEVALTRLAQTVERLVTERPAAAPLNDVAEDPAFNWDALRSPLENTFPLPSTGVVQRIAAGLFAKLQSGAITGRDQHEARFVLDILAVWPDLDDELRARVFKRLNLYAIVAAHGWPTAIAASAASTSNAACMLPPGVVPVQQHQGRQQREPQQRGRQGGRRQANQQAPAPAAPAPAPAPAPAQRGRRRR